MTNLLLPCLFFMIITIYLYTISKTNDKYLLCIMIFGQILLLIGSSIKNNILIEVSHIFFTLSIFIGVLFFKEKYNKYYIFFIILLTLFTREYFKDCLFHIANNNTTLINININYNYVYTLFLLILIYKLNI
jgi:hypothetical protein